MENKELVIGDFKPKRRFLNFISAIGGTNVRLISNFAFIKGKTLSGMLEGLKFKITICDEDTIKFEEIDTNVTDKAQLQRLIDDIDAMDVTGYAQKFVVPLEFLDVDGNKCYLEVEHKKPIDVLRSLFDDAKPELSEKGSSILDALFSSETEEEVIQLDQDENEDEIQVEKENKENTTQSYIEEQFRKMNQEKIEELKKRIAENEKESFRIKNDIRQSEVKLKKLTEDISVLESRLDDFNAKDDTNGYVFYVSEEQKPKDVGLTDENREIADKIADIVGLKKDVLFTMLTQGFYKIHIAEKDNIDSKDIKISTDALNRIQSLVSDKDSKITMVGTGEFEYRGELTWHQIVNKLIRKGFEQDPEFEKHCESNSYKSHEKDNCDCNDEKCNCDK